MKRSKTGAKRKPRTPVGRRAKSQYRPASDLAPRKTGIRVIGDMPWGTHICVFYETKKDLLDTAISYFRAGLESNEFCVWAVSEPVPMGEAIKALREEIPGFDRHLGNGQIELLRGGDWYLKGDQFDLNRIIAGWCTKLNEALAMGYDGMKVSGNAFWNQTNYWTEFCAYEQELEKILTGKKMIALCTYPLRTSRAVDILDVTRAHQCSISRRNGDWEFLETPELHLARREITRLHNALDILSNPVPGHEALTERERVALAQIVRGASSKEAGRILGVSPRTIEFHRANIMKKLAVKNTVDLVRKVLQGELRDAGR
jgi:DNA-binding CsgD family transcriptional regulator